MFASFMASLVLAAAWLSARPRGTDTYRLGTFEREGRRLVGLVAGDVWVADLEQGNAAFERASAGAARLAMLKDMKAGDVLWMGSPAGVGTARATPIYFKAGDTSVCTIEDIGTLTHAARAETDAPEPTTSSSRSSENGSGAPRRVMASPPAPHERRSSARGGRAGSLWPAGRVSLDSGGRARY